MEYPNKQREIDSCFSKHFTNTRKWPVAQKESEEKGPEGNMCCQPSPLPSASPAPPGCLHCPPEYVTKTQKLLEASGAA